MKKKLFSVFLGLFIAAAFFLYYGSLPLRPTRDDALPFPLAEGIRNALYYASLAPNAHNAQAWEVRYDSRTAIFSLALDRDRRLRHTDPDDREARLSLGAFLENFREAGMAAGYEVSIDMLNQPDPSGVAARMTLKPAAAPPAPAAVARLALMEKRHTDKRPFENKILDPATVQRLLEKRKPYLHYYPKGTPTFEYLAENAVRAMRAQSANRNKQKELADWLRFSDAEALATRDGLPAEQLGITGLRKSLYYLFYDRDNARSKEFALQAVAQTQEQVDHCSGFFVLTGGTSLPEQLHTGMALEAFWLDAAAEGIALHPLSQMLEERPFRDNIREDLGLVLPPQMVLRAGVLADYGQNYGIRRPLARFIHDTGSE